MFRTEYNGCKTFGCDNLGNPDLNLYTPSTRLGYPAYYCPKCGAYPPKLLNQPICALTRYIHQQRSTATSTFTPQCRCSDQSQSQSRTQDQPRIKAQWKRYDKTRIGTQRLKCSQCHTVTSLTNPNKLASSLQPLLDLLLSGCPANELLPRSGWNNKLFYQRLNTLSQLLEAASHIYEQHWLARQNSLTLHTHSHIVRCRSGLTRTKYHGLDCWMLTTNDSQTGYQFLISDNLLPYTSSNDHNGEYTLDEVEQPIAPSLDVLTTAKHTYQKIMSRQQFDKLAYCTKEHAKSNEGTLLRPVYAAHAHMQNLRLRLPDSIDIDLVLEHESFIRGAAITAFSKQVKQNHTDGKVNLYYLHAFRCNEPPSSPPATPSSKRTLSWWHEKWYQFPHRYQNENWLLGLGVLTQTSSAERSTLQNTVPTRPDWHTHFWHHFDAWLPSSHRQRISHTQLLQWISIFRYLYNFSETYLELGLHLATGDSTLGFEWCSVAKLTELANDRFIK